MPIPEEVRKILEKQQYRVVGRHSLVKICHWTKKSLSKNVVCFKEKWYPPVQSHRCMEMTPYFGCNFHCLHCWRIHSGDRNLTWKEFPIEGEIDEPSTIVEKCIEERKKLLSGFKGNVNKKKFEEALIPTMMTLSLTGEPTLYPKISEIIEEARKRKMITFLVTNGSMPNALSNLDPLPWQLYISLTSPDKETFIKACRPMVKDAWEKLNESIELFPSFECRKVIRITLIKGINMKNPKGYGKIILKSDTDFCEVKAYMHVGESQRRLEKEAMPSMEEVRKFSKRIANCTGYEIRGEDEQSRVVLLSKK